jgi:ammonia channel protein AmtB
VPVYNKGSPVAWSNWNGFSDMRLLSAAIVCVIFCTVGFVMAFRPKLYRRWVESSWTGRSTPKTAERWLQQKWSSRILGVLFMAFGVFSFIAFVLLMR